jgi:hypothetical protein
MKRILMTAALAALMGCTTATKIAGPGDKTTFMVACGGAALDRCYNKAAEICPNGYSVYDRTGHARINMIVECKN